jgi:hypothetical protein
MHTHVHDIHVVQQQLFYTEQCGPLSAALCNVLVHRATPAVQQGSVASHLFLDASPVHVRIKSPATHTTPSWWQTERNARTRAQEIQLFTDRLLP